MLVSSYLYHCACLRKSLPGVCRWAFEVGSERGTRLPFQYRGTSPEIRGQYCLASPGFAYRAVVWYDGESSADNATVSTVESTKERRRS